MSSGGGGVSGGGEDDPGPAQELNQMEVVTTRVGMADSDEQLQATLERVLVPVLQLFANTIHQSVRTAILNLFIHINRRVKNNHRVKMPVERLLEVYKVG